MKNEVFIRISREAKKVIGQSRFATVALEYLIHVHDHNRQKFYELTEEAQKYLDVVMNDGGRSRLIINRSLWYQALARVAGNSKLLKALIYLLALDRITVIRRYKEAEYGVNIDAEGAH